jgi:hypothetical protein
MRLLGAAIVVFVGMCVGVVLFSLVPVSVPLWFMGPLSVVLFFGLVGMVMVIFNGGTKVIPAVRESLDELRRRGLISTEVVRARRAFSVEEFEDEGPHYFLELEDRRVLYLNGKYLYDYCDDSAELRRFPTSDFEIHRHKTQGYVVEMDCRGKLLTLDMEALFNGKKTGLELPEDGEIIADKTYDQFRQEISAVIDPTEAI